MKKETIEPLEKNKITKVKTEDAGCCGGTPISNEDACCKLDEEKKSEGESGCGCNTSEEKETKKSCC